MALWTHNGAGWETLALHKLSRPGAAVLYGSGPSLNDADKVEENATRFVVNWGYKKVEPHVWIGMDDPALFGREIMDKPFLKIFRGPFANNPVDDIPAHRYGTTAFADVAPGRRDEIFFRKGADVKFLWLTTSIIVSIHLILWMGFREIIFSGIDLQGKHFDNRDLDKKHQDISDRVLVLEYDFLKWFAGVAKSEGIKLTNRSEQSRLKEFMATVPKGAKKK